MITFIIMFKDMIIPTWATITFFIWFFPALNTAVVSIASSVIDFRNRETPWQIFVSSVFWFVFFAASIVTIIKGRK